jgi:hypothetical protein
MECEIAVNWSINVIAINSYFYNSVIIKWHACPKMKSLLFRKYLTHIDFHGNEVVCCNFLPGLYYSTLEKYFHFEKIFNKQQSNK